ncbi:hypothetical protein A0H81_05223 [Grifola frondosa]|uniref:Uncharacterized protein n=1 Tax=Grifola frondosa TaxID=5627 RepID=A0A1C7MD87_GRIFR|nr:hypothetical protein A0H81_05223 [Grifola frondosa]
MRYVLAATTELFLMPFPINLQTTPPRHAPCWLYLAFSPSLFPFLLPIALTYADAVNITVDDTSSSIQYSPASSWHASSTPCSTCLAPNASIAFGGTWHDGTHIIPTEDDDDLPSAQRANAGSTNNSASQSHSSTSSPSPTASQKGGDDDKDSSNGKDDDNDDDDKTSAGKKHRRRGPTATANRLPRQTNNPFFTPNFDSDDAGFHDEPVTAQFNFTGVYISVSRSSAWKYGISFVFVTAHSSELGSAVYLFAIMPLGAAAANSTPTFMNLTYTLDSQPVGIFQHTGASSAFGFLPSVPVFSKSGLSEGPHSLTVQIGPDSVLLLDYIVYSQDNGLGLGSSPNEAVSTTQDTAGAQETASGTGSTGPSSNPATSNILMRRIFLFANPIIHLIRSRPVLFRLLVQNLPLLLRTNHSQSSSYTKWPPGRCPRNRITLRHSQAQSVVVLGCWQFSHSPSQLAFIVDVSSPPDEIDAIDTPVPARIPTSTGSHSTRTAPRTAHRCRAQPHSCRDTSRGPLYRPAPPYAPPMQRRSYWTSASPINSPVILWPAPRVPAPGEDLSYADRPPPTPPPMMEDGYFPHHHHSLSQFPLQYLRFLQVTAP